MADRNEVTAEERYIAMRYAVISDIHGNLPALDAVVEDAERNHTDGLIQAFKDEIACKILNMLDRG